MEMISAIELPNQRGVRFAGNVVHELDIVSDVTTCVSERVCRIHGPYIPHEPRRPQDCLKCGLEAVQRAAENDQHAFQRQRELDWIKHAYRLSQIPERYASATLENISHASLTADHIALIERVRRYAQNFESVKKKCIQTLLTGVPGTGKTMILCALAATLRSKGVKAVYTSHPMLGELRLDAYSEREDRETESQLITRYVGYEFLALDELGSGKDTSSENQFIAELLCRRDVAGRPTFIATNLVSAAEMKKFGDRLNDRMNSWVHLLCSWGSYRKKVNEEVF